MGVGSKIHGFQTTEDGSSTVMLILFTKEGAEAGDPPTSAQYTITLTSSTPAGTVIECELLLP